MPTKPLTYTTTALAMPALHLGRIRDLSPADGARLLAGMDALPEQIESIVTDEEHIVASQRDGSYPRLAVS